MNNKILRTENVREYLKRSPSLGEAAVPFSDDEIDEIMDIFTRSGSAINFIRNLKKRDFSEFKVGMAFQLGIQWAEEAREMRGKMKEPVIGYV